jgi:serine protease Do
MILIGGDILAAIDGEPIATGRDLLRFLDTRTEVGQTIQVTVWRDGQQVTMPVTLEEQPQ